MQKEGRQWKRTVCNLVDTAEVCANATFRSEPGRGCWDLRPLVCKEIGNDMLQELTANIYQGFNLQQEQEASGVGQCVCNRTEEHAGAGVVIRQTAVD